MSAADQQYPAFERSLPAYFRGIRLNQGLVQRVDGLLSVDAELTSREIVKRLDGYSSATSVRVVLRFLVAAGRARYEGEDGKRRYRRAGTDHQLDGVEHNGLPEARR